MLEKTKLCPYCGEIIKATAKKCRHCGEWLKDSANSSTNTKKCQYCGEEININATKCKHCNSWLVENTPVQKYEYCPFCHKAVPKNAEKCPSCGEWLKDEHTELSCGYGFGNPVVKILCILGLIFLALFLLMALDTGEWGIFFISLLCIPICVLVAYLYMFPTITACARNHPQIMPICLINIIFGETVIGWIGALVWATTHRQGRHTHW